MFSAIAAAAILLIAQQASRAVVADYPEERETWVLEYPAQIGDYVEDYYNCLKGGNYTVGDGRGFAVQYRADVPRCAALGASLERQANERLARNQGGNGTTPHDVATIFKTVQRIHVARGADLDKMVGIGLASSRQNRAAAHNAGNAECIASIIDLRNRRQAFAEAGAPQARALYAKDDYSDEDRKIILTYTQELLRLSNMLEFEMSRCPGSEFAEAVAAAEVPRGEVTPPG